MSRQKAVYDFTAYPRFHIRDSQPIHIPFYVMIGSYGSSPPNATQTNTYFFSGGFAVKVSL